MGAQMRVYRQRVRSVQATKKITRAMELIAASRVVKARQRVLASAPYTHALTRALSALATYSNEDHPLTTEREKVRRAGVVIIAGDRGLSGRLQLLGAQGERAAGPQAPRGGQGARRLPRRATAR